MITRSTVEDLETDSVIMWNATEKEAVMWTSSSKVSRQWAAYGFPVQTTPAGWQARVPVECITYKRVKKG